MKRRKNSNLHVVREPEDPTDKIIEEIMDELNSEDGVTEKEIQEELARRKRKKQKKIGIVIAVIAIAAILVYLLINLQTYTKVRVSDTYVGEGAADNNYVQFLDGVLKYSKDGISYLNQSGKEKWNQSYQIKNPMIDVSDKSAAVADKEGNDILILQEDGLKGEVHTTMPIEKVSVSEQGIVSAILKNDTSMKVICYDTAGNVLVEHKTSLAGTGYPVDVALSANGEVMQVCIFTRRMDRWCQDYIIITSGKPERMKPIIKYPVRIIRIRYWPPDFSWMQIHPWQSVMTVWPSIAEKKFRNSP